jgi:hypothetical protein
MIASGVTGSACSTADAVFSSLIVSDTSVPPEGVAWDAIYPRRDRAAMNFADRR